MTRTITFITGSRGEYGYIRPILHAIERTPGLDYNIVVTNLHLLPEFGLSIRDIEKDNFKISDRIYMAFDAYTPASMAKSLGAFLMSVTDVLDRLRPDVVLLAGDRGEQLMAAIAAAHMNIVVAHVQAGERSGNIDGMTRHAIARYAHLHFAANDDAAQRLVRVGEQPFRIHLTGAPQLDEILHGEYASPVEVRDVLKLPETGPIILYVQHPVTEEYQETVAHVRETYAAVCELGHPVVALFPNNDAGSTDARHVLDGDHKPFVRIERTLPRRLYLGLMRIASVLVGNSSSGLIEAPLFSLPTVNVGTRQRDRFRGKNVIDVQPERAQIAKALARALDPQFRAGLAVESPYLGDGAVAARIVDVLAKLDIDEQLLKKQLAY